MRECRLAFGEDWQASASKLAMAEVSGKKGVRQSQKESRKKEEKIVKERWEKKKTLSKSSTQKLFCLVRRGVENWKDFHLRNTSRVSGDVESGLDHEAWYIGTLEWIDCLSNNSIHTFIHVDIWSGVRWNSVCELTLQQSLRPNLKISRYKLWCPSLQ